MKQFKLSRKRKKQYKKFCGIFWNCWNNKERWEWNCFERRVQVRCMEIITYPYYNKETNEYEFDPSLYKPATNVQLLERYKKWYPNDKLAHHYCKQNRHRWVKFNRLF